MDGIVAEVEADPHYRNSVNVAHSEPEPTIADAISCALRRTTSILPVAAVVAYTSSGATHCGPPASAWRDRSWGSPLD